MTRVCCRINGCYTNSRAETRIVGIFNTYFFIDPRKELGVAVLMQVLPFYDQAAMNVDAGVEEALYKNVK